MNRLTREGDGCIEHHIVDGERHTIKFAGVCATPECVALRSNVDRPDPRSVAYYKATGVELVGVISDGAFYIVMANPAGAAARISGSFAATLELSVAAAREDMRKAVNVLNEVLVERYLAAMKVVEQIRAGAAAAFRKLADGQG